jgi:hypothetical protein
MNNVILWGAVILLADVLLVLFVRSSDDRRQDSRKRETRLGVQ